MSKLAFDYDNFKFVKTEDKKDEEVKTPVLASFPMALGRSIDVISEDGELYMKGIQKIKMSNMRITSIRWNCLFGDKIKQQMSEYDKLSDGQLYDVVTIPDINNEIGFTYVFGNSESAKIFINSMMDFASSLVIMGKVKEQESVHE